MNASLNALDSMNSPIWIGNPARCFAYTPLGVVSPPPGAAVVSGYNGERQDPISQTYHLGNGYRSYNPMLMRFAAPDSWSPFGAGGLNAYLYCEGDPVNRTDPSGHLSGQAWAGIGLGIVGLLGIIVTGGMAIAAEGGVMAAILSADAVDLVAGGLGAAADIAAIASGAASEANPDASRILGWISFGLGIVGGLAGVAQTGKAAHARLRGRSDTIELWRGSAGLDGPGPGSDDDKMIYVGTSEYRSAGQAQGIATEGMGDCTSVAIYSEQEKALIHVNGSNLNTRMARGPDEMAGDVFNETLLHRQFRADDRIAVVYGVNNGTYGYRMFLSQKYQGRKPVLDLLSKFQPDRISFFQSVDFEIDARGAVRQDLMNNHLITGDKRQTLLDKVSRYTKKRGLSPV